MSTDDDEESSGKVRRIVLETNRRTKGETDKGSAFKGTYKGKGEASKGAKGRGASTDTGACSFQSRGPVKPSLVLEPAPSWADESEQAAESQTAARSTEKASLVLREKGAGVSEQAEGTVAVRSDSTVAVRAKPAEDTFDVDLDDEDDPEA